MKNRLKIDVVADIVCPWCYIGKQRLEKALKTVEDEFDFEIEYHPFELNPGIPAEGLNQREYLVEKFGGEERYESILAKVTEHGLEEGLFFDFKKQKISPNTRKAHCLIQLAQPSGRQGEMIELLFKAYFTEGVDLSSEANLVALGIEAGLEMENIETMFSDERAMLQVALAEQELYKQGIAGVPFYIINKKYGISGAQSSETFKKAIRDIGKETKASESPVDR